MSDAGEKVPIGRITGPHGVRGEVKVFPFGGVDRFVWKKVYLLGHPAAYVIRKSEWAVEKHPEGVVVKKILKVRSARRHGRFFLVTFSGVETRDEAEAITGFTVAVPEEELPVLPEGEYYHRDLVGLEVVKVDGTTLGTVKGIITTGGSDVLEVEGPAGETLLPFSEDVVMKIDLEKRRITVRPLPGLAEEEKKK